MGRPRRYDFTPLDGFSNQEIAYMAAILEEEAERLCDLITDQDQAMLHFVPDGTTLSSARMTRHVVWGEASWIRKICNVEAPSSFSGKLQDAALDSFSNPPVATGDAAKLIGLIRSLRSEYSLPQLRALKDVYAPISAVKGPSNIKEVLMHLIWHWTYHTAHIGLIRLQAGSDYVWSF